MATAKLTLSELAIAGYRWPTAKMRAQTVNGDVYIAQRVGRKWLFYRVGNGLTDPPFTLSENLSIGQARAKMREVVENDWREIVLEPLEY